MHSTIPLSTGFRQQRQINQLMNLVAIYKNYYKRPKGMTVLRKSRRNMRE